MTNLFLPILDMSVTGGIVILAVMAIRMFLKGVPKIFSYILWSVAAFRLCCPVSFRSHISIFNLKEQTDYMIPAVTDTVATPTQTYDVISLLSVLWLCGMTLLLIYSIIAYYRLKVRLAKAVLMYDNVYCAEGLPSPFVLGFMSPKIYIPFGLAHEQREYILKHERTHIRRGDHLVKLFAFAILCVHWFNPLCWIAFILMSRDMEMSCDEKVLKSGSSIKVYSNALLSMAVSSRFPSPGPISFGEVGVKQRIKNILHWKKPAVWITVISVLLCITALTVFATDPVEEKEEPPKVPEITQTLPDTTDTTTVDTTTVDSTTADTTTADTTTVKITTADTTGNTVKQTEKTDIYTTPKNTEAPHTEEIQPDTDDTTWHFEIFVPDTLPNTTFDGDDVVEEIIKKRFD